MSSWLQKRRHRQAKLERRNVKFEINMETAPGWVGGFEETNEAFSFPDPDVTSLQIQGNMDNIDKLERQIRIVWPEFSWQTIPGVESSRCYQMFAPDISRVGYTKEGRIYSVICPQQGVYIDFLGSLNVEVTVIGNRGWVNEDNPVESRLAGQVGVQGNIWFSEDAAAFPLVRMLSKAAQKRLNKYKFPFSKANAIKVNTHAVDDPTNPWFDVKAGLSDTYTAPDWTRHPEAYQKANLAVQIGAIQPTGNDKIDDFNNLILDIFNLGGGNVMKAGNILTWNIWTDHPQPVDVDEWQAHAEKWRKSLKVDHGSPGGKQSKVRYKNGAIYKPGAQVLQELQKTLWRCYEFIKTGKVKKKAPKNYLKQLIGMRNLNMGYYCL